MLNIRLKDRLADHVEMIRCLALENGRRRNEIQLLLKEKLPYDSPDWNATASDGEIWRLADKMGLETPKKGCDTRDSGSWGYLSPSYTYESTSRGSQAISTLTKRPPQA